MTPTMIVTRPLEDAAAFGEAAHRAGFTPVLSPILSIVPAAPQPLSPDVGALIFTSANGVRHCGVRRFNGPVFVVGGATAAAAAGAGFKDVRTADGEARSLASHIAAARDEIVGKAVHFSGEHRAADLAALLSGADVIIERVVVYSARPAAALSAQALAAIADRSKECWVSFFSPRAASIFLQLAQRHGRIEDLQAVAAACLSAEIAQTASQVTWRAIVVASERTGKSLLAAAAEHASIA